MYSSVEISSMFVNWCRSTQRELVERMFAEVGRRPKLMVLNRPLMRVLGLFDSMPNPALAS